MSRATTAGSVPEAALRRYRPGTWQFRRQGVPARRRAARCRAAATRAATVLLDSGPSVRARSVALTGRTSTWMSTRSSRGPESREK